MWWWTCCFSLWCSTEPGEISQGSPRSGLYWYFVAQVTCAITNSFAGIHLKSAPVGRTFQRCLKLRQNAEMYVRPALLRNDYNMQLHSGVKFSWVPPGLRPGTSKFRPGTSQVRPANSNMRPATYHVRPGTEWERPGIDPTCSIKHPVGDIAPLSLDPAPHKSDPPPQTWDPPPITYDQRLNERDLAETRHVASNIPLAI